MKIELDRSDIINEISENYSNDADFLFEIVDESTRTWEPVRELTKRLIEFLGSNDQLFDIEETFNNEEK